MGSFIPQLSKKGVFNALCMKRYMFVVPFLVIEKKMILWLRILALWSFRDFSSTVVSAHGNEYCSPHEVQNVINLLLVHREGSRGVKEAYGLRCISIVHLHVLFLILVCLLKYPLIDLISSRAFSH